MKVLIDKDALKRRLTDEGYAEFNADEMVQRISKIDTQLYTALNAWIKDGTVASFEVNGVTLPQIMEKTRTTFYHALFLMSIFIKNPDKAQMFKETPAVFFQR